MAYPVLSVRYDTSPAIQTVGEILPEGLFVALTSAGAFSVSQIDSVALDIIRAANHTRSNHVQFDGTRYWTCTGTADVGNSNVSFYDNTGAFVADVDTSQGGNSVLCIQGPNLWVGNANTNVLTQILTAAQVVINSTTLSAPTFNFVTRMLFELGYLWAMGWDGVNAPILVQISTASGDAVATFTLTGLSSASDFVFDGTNFIVSDGIGNQIAKVSSVGAILSTSPLANAAFMAFDSASNLWVGQNAVTERISVQNPFGTEVTSYDLTNATGLSLGAPGYISLMPADGSMWLVSQNLGVDLVSQFSIPATPPVIPLTKLAINPYALSVIVLPFCIDEECIFE